MSTHRPGGSPTTNREKFLKKHGLPSDYSPTMREIAQLSDMPVQAAYHTNPESVRVKGTFKKDPEAPLSRKLSPQQWAQGRVMAFVMKTKKVFYGADRHIAEEFGLL
jgi:hypothetical protein